MLRGTPALASVFLCFVCVFSQKSHQATNLCIRDMITRVTELIKQAPQLNQLDSTLYTPTLTDYKNCPRAALKCFAAEVKVFIDEWELLYKQKVQKSFRLEKMIDRLAARLPQGESDCLQCESLKEENVENFLTELRLILQHINSQFCT
ncbi:interleukin 15, like isoform X2 [Anabas testudineus]|uniref:interleukin 15, like isoform X2 n=1 Tax=Anabas testudineus TaxID=64144 RepID=UPI00143E055D|nr:interleukin 15, like isoform X2 [Anabas testudineus]